MFLVDGKPVHLHRQKTIALLAYLAVTNVPHSRERLCDILWPDLNEKKARANLRTCLSECRHYFSEHLVLSEGANLFIPLGDNTTCDVIDFQKAISGGKNDTSNRENCLTTATILYKGPFLQGLSLPDCPDFDDWQFETQQQMLVSYTLVLEELVPFLSKGGRVETALIYARDLLDLDPCREDRHRMIMELHATLGDFKAALGQFDILQHQLQRDGLPGPKPKTRELAMALSQEVEDKSTSQEDIGTSKCRQRIRPFLATAIILSAITAIILFIPWNQAPAPQDPISIAVLPFRFLCMGDGVAEAAEYFTNEMITTLAQDPFFAVTPHVSVRQYRETIKTVTEIAEELDVCYILEGVTQTQGSLIRFSVQLIDTKMDECIWADLYEGDFTGGIEFQQEVTEYLAKSIKREAQNW